MPPSRIAPRTLIEVVDGAAERFPDRSLAIFDGRGRNVERRTYGELRAAIVESAARLAGLGLIPRDRVLVCLPSSWEWMGAWLGTLFAGGLPVAVAPAGAMGSSAGHTRKVAELARHLGARWVIAPDSLKDQAQALSAKQEQATEETDRSGGALRELAELVLTPDELASQPQAKGFRQAHPDAEEIAFLQLTSGSTGRPRAVMIRHCSATHNSLASDHAIGLPHGGPVGSWADAMVSWLPLHHDMGLVGCLFLSLTLGLDLWLMNPTTFLARPKLWLDTLGQRETTFAPAPNFGYQLCVERLAEKGLDGLDLSGWRAAMTGAEMVRPETIAAFLDLTREQGFAPETFRPCYGLAEGTLAVSFDVAGEGLRTAAVPSGASGEGGQTLEEVACLGPPILDTELRIVGPDGRSLPEDTVGEVLARGPGIFAGYWNDAEATAQALEGDWLLTGDLGFRDQGELYITGRIKDLLIVRGHNIMPHEIEWLAEEVTGGGGALRSGAFSRVLPGEEGLGEQAVLVVETTERSPQARQELAERIRRRIGRALSLPLADVAFVRRGKIPKTTSGKVQRRQLQASYLDGTLERLSGDDGAPETG